jgi:hypothetical protein
MPVPGQLKRGQPADAPAAPSRPPSGQELAADVIRYHTLARELAVQRKAGQRGQPGTSNVGACPAAGAHAPATLLSRDGSEAFSLSRRDLALGAVLLALALLAAIAAWRSLDDGELNGRHVPNTGADVNQSREGTQPEAHVGGADFASAPQLLLPLETALIANAAQTEALADLRHHLRQAEALAASYATLLAQERAHGRVLEEQLAAYQTAPSVPSAPASDMASLSPEAQPPAESQRSTPSTLAPKLPAAELDRLMMRASRLREQGDIAAARTVLESGAELGHGPALFALAETYDPAVLSAWRTFGTQGDVEKARELYEKAEAAGVGEAADRLKSLPH